MNYERCVLYNCIFFLRGTIAYLNDELEGEVLNIRLSLSSLIVMIVGADLLLQPFHFSRCGFQDQTAFS